MISALDSSVRRLRRRIAFGAWFGRTARAGALLALLGALCALFARALFGWPLEHAAWFLAPVALAPLVALVGLRRRLPSDRALTTWLDLAAGAHGLVVTSGERPDARWGESLERELARLPEPPVLRVAGPSQRFLLACAFAAAALLVPLARPAPGPDGTLYEQLLAGLGEKLAALDEVVDLDPDTARELTERLGRLAELAEERVGLEGLLESIDALSDRMEAIGGEVAEAGLAAADSLARAASEALSDPQGARELLAQALAAIDAAGLAEKLPAGLAELARRFEGADRELLADLEISGEDLRAWSEALRAGVRVDLDTLSRAGLAAISEAELARMARTLSELIDQEHVCDAACKAGGACTGAGRAGGPGTGASGLSSGEFPGRAGVNRGRADAELYWGREAEGAEERFAAQALPPARAADLEHSAPIATGAGAPEVAAQGEAAGSEGARGSQGGSSWRRRLSPRHRKAVQEFFAPSQDGPR